MTFKEIAEEVGVNVKTLYDWRNAPEYTLFQDELNRLNNARWQSAEDVAREGAIKLCKAGNQKMIQFVLQNCGYNPTHNVKADVDVDAKDIVINILE